MIDANYKVKQKRILHHSQSVAVIGQIDFQNIIADDIALDHFLIHPVCLICDKPGANGIPYIIYAKQQFQSGCVQHIQQRHGFPAQPLTSCPVLQGTVRGVLLQYTVRRSTPPVIQSAARAMDELWERNTPFLLAGN